MGLSLKDDIAVFGSVVGVDSAEELLAWLQQYPTGRVDLRACTHMHAALVQVLMALSPPLEAWPEEPGLKSWLTTALTE